MEQQRPRRRGRPRIPRDQRQKVYGTQLSISANDEIKDALERLADSLGYPVTISSLVRDAIVEKYGAQLGLTMPRAS